MRGCRIEFSHFKTQSFMKWIIGALVLGVFAAVNSGRVPLNWVVYSFSVLYLCWGLALLFAYSQNKIIGQLLLACTYILGAIVCVYFHHWWPLLVSFALAWGLRLLGFDPPAVNPDLASNPIDEKSSIDK